MNNRIEAGNLALFYRKAAERFAHMPAFAIRRKATDWQPVTYREVYEQGLDFASGLIELGVNARDRVGIFSDNRFEWMLSDYAIQFCGAADVPRARDVSDSELEYIIGHAGIEVVLVETEDLQKRVLALKSTIPTIREIICINPKAKLLPEVKPLADVVALGAALRKSGDRRAEERIKAIRPDDLFTLIYTSGTTGQPKGVMLTHSNIMSQIRNLPGIYNCTDRVVSVLPIWHVFERVIEMYTISFGGCTYYSSVLTLGDDMRNVEPTFMASAPRVWEKLHERIIKNVKASHPVRQMLFHIAYFLAKNYTNSLYFMSNKNLKMKAEPFWKRALLMPFHVLRWLIVLPWYGFFNAAVLERIRLGAGGSLKMTISGGGALPIHIDRFFNNVGIPVLEGYGLTETSPVIAVRSMLNLVVGTVGPPLPETEIRIIHLDSGEILYPNKKYPDNGMGQRGEIWVRGPQVMKGYYKDPELTDAVIKDGWFRTGDVGIITHNNCVKILGRSKATIVLSSGENVEPEPIEMHMQQSRYIDHCMLVGQDKKHTAALIVPALQEFRQAGFSAQNVEELIADPNVQKIMRDEVRKMNASPNGFKRYELIRDFRLLQDSFQIGHELTNLYKIKRHVVTEKYNHIISEMYPEKQSKN
jgi:long-chain acyl-CoA synthetase